MKSRVINRTCNYSGSKIAQGLSLTPHQMLTMTREGIAVSPQNLDATGFFDGIKDVTFDVPIEQRRGVDMADLWEARQETFGQIRKAHKKQLMLDKLAEQKTE